MPNVRELDFSDIPESQSKRSGNVESLSFDDIPSAPLSPLQGGAALASGFNRAAMAGTLGLPVKTALDVADMARAAYGYVGGKTGLLKPEDLPQPLDRGAYIGSPEWIAAQIEKTEAGKAAISNPRPDNAVARVLNASGYGVGSGFSGRPGDIAMNLASGASGQLATEAGASPEWAMVASMAPQVGLSAGQEGLRRVARGGEEGRREMERRADEFRAAGVEPTVGLASGRRLPQAVESTLARTPGAAGAMAAKAEEVRGGLQDTVNAARDSVSPVYGPVAAGDAIKRGAEQYRERQQAIFEQMRDSAIAKVPPGMTFPADAMIARGQATLADVPGAPNVSRVLNQPRAFTQNVVQALERDAMGQGPQNVPSAILRENGQPFTRELPGTQGGLPIDALGGLRTRIGDLAFAASPLNADANTGALKHLYGGAKQDLMQAARLADTERARLGQQPGVYAGLDRADRFYQVTSKVLDEVLAPLHKAADGSPEKAYGRVESMSKTSGANVQRLMASAPLDVRRTISATVIDGLGKANPGGQNAEGTAFSPQTFLTNWNKVTPEAKTGIFLGIPQGQQVRQRLEMVAKAAERMNDAGKVWANPSGTAGAVAAYGTGAGIGTGLALMSSGNVKAGSALLGSILTSAAMARAGAWAMTNPKTVNWLSQATVMTDAQMAQHLRRLSMMAAQEKDPKQQAALMELANDLSAELGER